MKTKAAVAVEAGKPLEIMDVDLEGPRVRRGFSGNKGNRYLSY